MSDGARIQRIPIRPATAEVLNAVAVALHELHAQTAALEARFHDLLTTLYTEAGIKSGTCTEITETAPHEIVVQVDELWPEEQE